MSQKEELLFVIFKNTPRNYWSVYTYLLSSELEKAFLFSEVVGTEDYYDSYLSSKTWQRFPEPELGAERWEEVCFKTSWGGKVEVKVVCIRSGDFYKIHTSDIEKTVYDIFIGRRKDVGWLSSEFMKYYLIEDVYKNYRFYIDRLAY